MKDSNLQYLKFFYNNIQKIETNLNIKVDDKQLCNSFVSIYSVYEAPLEQARFQIITQSKLSSKYPENLLSQANCSCFSKGIKNFWLRLNKNLQCTESINGFNPFSFHFINFDLKDTHMKVKYAQTLQKLSLNYDLDSKYLLLNLASLVCKKKHTNVEGRYTYLQKHCLGRFVVKYLYLYDKPCICGICCELEKWES
ncbi:hypothetical protein BDAP_000611 [Binucleata daphniae]